MQTKGNEPDFDIFSDACRNVVKSAKSLVCSIQLPVLTFVGPVVRTGKLCIEVTPTSKIAFISETLWYHNVKRRD